MDFSESLFQRNTPWAACAALESFFSQGKQCRPDEGINWLGILSACESKMRNDASKPPDQLAPPSLHESFAWAHLAILISESLALNAQSNDRTCSSHRAMAVRAQMIIRCGNVPGDQICDLDNVVGWCMSEPAMLDFLTMEVVPPIRQVDPSVRLNADLLLDLVKAKRLEPKGNVAQLLDRIKDAKRKAGITD